jgi:hypothetical protein
VDPQAEAKYIGMGLLFESMSQAIGSFRALSVRLAQQHQEKDTKIKELEDKLAQLQAVKPE